MVRIALSFKQTLTGVIIIGALMTWGCTTQPKSGVIDLEEYRRALAATDDIALIEPDSALEAEALQRFEDFYAVYSEEVIREGIRDLYADDAWFGDPFHQVQGVDAMERYFVAMAEPAKECTFMVDDIQRSGPDYYARWTMQLVSEAAPKERIEALGFSHVRFNEEGKIIFQQDYWDTSAMFDRLPVVGFWTRLVKGRLAKRFE